MITEKQKFTGVVVMLPVVMLLIYFVVLSRTLHLSEEVERLAAGVGDARKTTDDLQELMIEVSGQEELLKKAGQTDSLDLFFSDISLYCDERGVLLRNYPSRHFVKQQEYVCYTRVVVVEGSYRDLVYLIDHVESERKNQLKALLFEVVKGRGSGSPRLQLKLYVQSVSRQDQ